MSFHICFNFPSMTSWSWAGVSTTCCSCGRIGSLCGVSACSSSLLGSLVLSSPGSTLSTPLVAATLLGLLCVRWLRSLPLSVSFLLLLGFIIVPERRNHKSRWSSQRVYTVLF